MSDLRTRQRPFWLSRLCVALCLTPVVLLPVRLQLSFMGIAHSSVDELFFMRITSTFFPVCPLIVAQASWSRDAFHEPRHLSPSAAAMPRPAPVSTERGW